MLCGCNPFDPFGTATDSEILHNVVAARIDTDNEMWAHISAPCKDLIRGLLTVDPRKRLTAEQVQEHMFFLCVHVSAAIPARSKEAAE